MYEDKYIPLNKLTHQENEIIGDQLEAVGQAESLGSTLEERFENEKVANARNEILMSVAMQKGLDSMAAKRLTDHFNAASEMVMKFPAEEKKKFYDRLRADGIKG